MRSINQALRIVPATVESVVSAQPAVQTSNSATATAAARAPILLCKPLLRPALPRRFVRVPTHAVGVHEELREYPRATLQLPLKLRAVAGVAEDFPITLVTRDVSSTGVYFLCPRDLSVGSSIELEIVLISKPLGQGNVVAATMAHVCRTDPAAVPGWYGIAASFDDMEFDRDDSVPTRFGAF